MRARCWTRSAEASAPRTCGCARPTSSAHGEDRAEFWRNPDHGGGDITTLQPPPQVRTRWSEIIEQDQTAWSHHGHGGVLMADLARTGIAEDQVERAVSGKFERVSM